MKARPVLDRIIIKQDEAADKIGNFILADNAKERPRQGVVVAVGPGEIVEGKTIPMMTKVGDRVQYADFIGANVTIDDEEYVVVRERDLYFIL